MKDYFQSIEFIKSSTEPTNFPDTEGRPQVVFVGRSNVGKSSLINHLFNRKKIAKTSNTPGKTQLINCFLADNDWILVDLPGYGYAKVAKSIQKEWGPMLENYFQDQYTHIKLVLWLVDIRRTLNTQDWEIYEWLQNSKLPYFTVFTKADKLNQSDRCKQVKYLLKTFSQSKSMFHTTYSCIKGWGQKDLKKQVIQTIFK